MAKRPDDLIYAVDERPPFMTLLALGLQHAALLSIYLVMIVIVFRAANASHAATISAVSLGMVAIAIASVLQALRKGPIGSGYLAPPVFSAIYLGPSVMAAESGGLAAVFGLTIFAGALEMLIASYLHRLRVIFPPALSGFIVVIVGIQLGLVAIDHVLGIDRFGEAGYRSHLIVAGLTLACIFGLAVWAGGMARLMCSMIGIVVGFLVAIALGHIEPDRWQSLSEVAFVALPGFEHIDYGFETSLVPAFLVAGIAAALRAVGVVTTCQKINDADWKRPDIKTIKGGVYADGIGCMLGGLLGVTGMNTGPSLVGVSKASGATSRVIAFAAAGILILFALSPKIGALFIILPEAVVGAALLFTASFMIAGGVQIMVARNIDTRMTFVIGVPMVLGLGREVYHDYFRQLPRLLQPLTNTMLSLAVVSALALHLLFRLGSKRIAKLDFKDVDDPEGDLSDLLRRRGSGWGVDDEVIERAVSTSDQVLEHIHRAHLVAGNLRAQISYDDYTLVVAIEYSGTLLSLPNVGVRRGAFLEEEAFSYGLADFLTNVYPDRMEASARGLEVSIKLYFST
ncbi:MAG: solute carrier family 23 protein [Pseudomonadota bacterium]